MIRPSLLLGTLLLGTLLPLAAPPPAAAYKVLTYYGKELRWAPLPMTFNIHQAGGPGVTASAFQAAVRAAYSTWSTVSCSYFQTKDMGVVNQPQSKTSDHINTHIFLSGWPSSYDANALAVTGTIYDASGTISDADTLYNPEFTWGTTGAYNAVDVQSVATHEIGHQLGLDHSPVTNATMFYATSGQGDTSMRSLASDDIAGLCHLYPTGTTPPPECTTGAQCAPNETCDTKTQKCVNSIQKGYGGTCSSNGECVSGLCLESSGTTFCTQACDSQPCPNGDQCVPVTGGGGVVNKACLPNSANIGTKTLGQPCTAVDDCKSQLCVSVPAKGYLCSQKCDLQKQDCPTGYTCVTSTAGGLCIPGDTTPSPPPPPPPGAELGAACTASSDCASDLCIQSGPAKVCSQVCDQAKAGSCPSGYNCVAAGTTAVCVKASSPPPPPPPGKGAVGADCTKNDDCESNLCGSGGDRLFCTALCDPARGCAGDYDCVSAGGNQFACAPKAINPQSSGGSGCVYGVEPSIPPGWLLLLVLALPLLLLARRR